MKLIANKILKLEDCATSTTYPSKMCQSHKNGQNKYKFEVDFISRLSKKITASIK